MSRALKGVDPFNCPVCGSHDYGLHVQLVGDCLHCLKRDAWRYRWLRDERLTGEYRGVLFAQAMGWKSENLTPRQVDAALDVTIRPAQSPSAGAPDAGPTTGDTAASRATIIDTTKEPG